MIYGVENSLLDERSILGGKSSVGYIVFEVCVTRPFARIYLDDFAINPWSCAPMVHTS
jgi:hypothetical protein